MPTRRRTASTGSRRVPGPCLTALPRRVRSAAAPVAEVVDAADSKSVARKGVLVRVRPGAPDRKAQRFCSVTSGLRSAFFSGHDRCRRATAADFSQQRGKIEHARPVPQHMTGHWRILWLAVGGVVCLDWAAKLWLLSFLCATCTPAEVALTSASPPVSTERISQAGIHYGDCASVILAVVLVPEPCGWERALAEQTAGRSVVAATPAWPAGASSGQP